MYKYFGGCENSDLLGVCPGVEPLPDQSMFSLGRYYQTVFQRGSTSLYSALTDTINTLHFPILNFGHFELCIVYLFEALICLSLMRIDVEHILTFMGHRGISSVHV